VSNNRPITTQERAKPITVLKVNTHMAPRAITNELIPVYTVIHCRFQLTLPIARTIFERKNTGITNKITKIIQGLICNPPFILASTDRGVATLKHVNTDFFMVERPNCKCLIFGSMKIEIIFISEC
jgi:hypothetical protein